MARNSKRRSEIIDRSQTEIPTLIRRYEVHNRTPNDLPEQYRREVKEAGIGANGFPSFEELRDAFRDDVNPDIRAAIDLLGDPATVGRKPVHTPQVAGLQGAHMERETFKWFVENERQGKRQYLSPVTKDTESLKPLNR